MKLLVAILIVIIILCFVSFYCIYSNLIQPLKDENHRCRKEVQDINNYNLKLEQQRKKLEESYYCASEKALELARELSVTKDVVTKQAEEIGLLKNDLTVNEDLEDKRQVLLDSLASVQNAIQERNILLHEMDLKIKEETARLDEAHRKEKDSLKAMQTMETRSKEIEAEVKKLMAQQEDLKTRIEDLKAWHRLALQEHNKEKEETLQGVRLELYGREVKMTQLLNELKESYGEILASDLANIEWKRIWLPKIQEVCAMKMLETRSGIYMIKVHGGRRATSSNGVVEGNAPEAKCYVGQAANIKERWYQHIKRMLGVDGTKGNERLYDEVDGHVERCEWIVLEEWNGESSGSDRNEWLDEREKYWIEYFGCKEWGLNKK